MQTHRLFMAYNKAIFKMATCLKMHCTRTICLVDNDLTNEMMAYVRRHQSSDVTAMSWLLFIYYLFTAFESSSSSAAAQPYSEFQTRVDLFRFKCVSAAN